MKETYKVEIDCPNCAAKIEAAVKNIDGVAGANVNFMMQNISLEFAHDADVECVKKTVAKTFRKIERDSRIYF